MAAVPITINGVICDLYGRTITGPVKIVGEAMLSGVGVGGGPIVPPDKPPVDPGLKPTHPIVIPEPPTEPPATPSDPKPPPADGGWGWHPEYGWGYFPGPGQPQPKG